LRAPAIDAATAPGPNWICRRWGLSLRRQVLQNRESGALQYAMRDRLTALGLAEIEVIDDDLGRSAAGGVQRAGFERMLAEVCLGKVGAPLSAPARTRSPNGRSSTVRSRGFMIAARQRSVVRRVRRPEPRQERRRVMALKLGERRLFVQTMTNA
jgi:hypothetical protein